MSEPDRPDKPQATEKASSELSSRMADDPDLVAAYTVEEQFHGALKVLESVAEAVSGDAFPDEIEWSDTTLSRDEVLARFEEIFDELPYIGTYLRQHAKDRFEHIKKRK